MRQYERNIFNLLGEMCAFWSHKIQLYKFVKTEFAKNKKQKKIEIIAAENCAIKMPRFFVSAKLF